MKKLFMLLLCAALVTTRSTYALSLDANALISYETQVEDSGAVSPITTSVSVTWDNAKTLSYKWTETGDGWRWIPSPVEVVFTIANNSVCNEATVSATLSGLTYGRKERVDFALEGAQIGLSGTQGGTLGNSALTGPLSCVCGDDDNPVAPSEVGIGHLYYAIRPAEGAGLTHEAMDALGSAAVSAEITFDVTMDSSAHVNCTSGIEE